MTPNDPNDPQEHRPSTELDEAPAPSTGVSRRLFLKRSGAVAAVGGAGGITVATTSAQEVTPVASDWDPVPAPPESAPESTTFFRPDQAALVEAIVSRIFPGDESDPGAREAGVLYYIDHLLTSGYGFPEPTYRQPPFAMTYTGDTPPEEPDQEFGYQVIWVPEDQIDRYGYQTVIPPRLAYERGLPAIDRFAQTRFGSSFVDLSEEQQDELIGAMADGSAEGFDEPSAQDFFDLIRTHTIEGLFSDPLYGGNRNLVGWTFLRYPGAQRAYTPPELKQEGTDRTPQGLADLPHFHAGRQSDLTDPVLPVRGTDEHAGHDEEDDDQ